MRALDIKLGRDLWKLRAQVLTIALVVAIGVGGFVGLFSVHASLLQARDDFYRSHRLADVFVNLKRAPTALGKPIATLENIRRRLGEAELLIHQARIHLRHAADLWVRRPEYRSQMEELIVTAKYVATNNAIRAVDHAMRVVGGASMSRTLPLERYYRDVRAGLSHPLADDQALLLLGDLALDRYRPTPEV